MAQRSREEKPRRGLASADKETRTRVARAGGRAPHAERGLEAATKETRSRVARAGGKAPHAARGLQAAPPETRERVARAGGRAPHEERGLQAASVETRERVAQLGGRASHGGGRTARARQAISYDESAGQCRDRSGRFVECPPELKSASAAEVLEKDWSARRE